MSDKSDLPGVRFTRVEEGGATAVARISPTQFNFVCGSGCVSICLQTGRVTLHDCALDDAALAFWGAVERIKDVHDARRSSQH